MVERLLRFGHTFPERPVLFCEGDRDLLRVSRSRDQLAAAFRGVVAEQLELPVPGAVKWRTPMAPCLTSASCACRSSQATRAPRGPTLQTIRQWRQEPSGRYRRSCRRFAVSSPRRVSRSWPKRSYRPGDAHRELPLYLDISVAIVGEFAGRKIRMCLDRDWSALRTRVRSLVRRSLARA